MARHYIRWFEEIGIGDVASVGGKNASLGEMVRNLGRYGIKVPPGFAITADGYGRFIEANNLETLIASRLAELKGERPPSRKPARRSGPRSRTVNGPRISRTPLAKPTGTCRSA
jgi:phosphoenolpyruvate synthase/pyruvate phosphate dikinase